MSFDISNLNRLGLESKEIRDSLKLLVSSFNLSEQEARNVYHKWKEWYLKVGYKEIPLQDIDENESKEDRWIRGKMLNNRTKLTEDDYRKLLELLKKGYSTEIVRIVLDFKVSELTMNRIKHSAKMKGLI